MRRLPFSLGTDYIRRYCHPPPVEGTRFRSRIGDNVGHLSVSSCNYVNEKQKHIRDRKRLTGLDIFTMKIIIMNLQSLIKNIIEI